MKLKSVFKLAVDIAMTVVLLFLMGYHLWGEAPHEWAGIGMFVLFSAHHVLNAAWYKRLFIGRYSAIRILILCIDCLVMAAMAAQMCSSVIISRYVFGFIPFSSGMALARRIHILGAYWGFLFMSLHMGIHWGMISGIIRKAIKIKSNPKLYSGISFIISLAVSVYGVYSFVSRDFFTYLFLKSEFVFLDYGELPVLFYFDYLSVMWLCISAAHHGAKIIGNFKKKAEKRQ